MEQQQKEKELKLRKERALLALNQREQVQHAIYLAEQMLCIDPNNKDALYILGEGYFKMEDYNKALHYLGNVLHLNPLIDWIQFGLGASLIKVGRVDYAFGHLKKAIELNPNQPEYYVGLGEYFFQQKDYDQAILCFEKAYSLGTNNLDALNNYGILLLEHKKSPQEALVVFRKIIYMHPNHTMYHKNFIRVLKINHPLYNFLVWKKAGIYLNISFLILWVILLLADTPPKFKVFFFFFGLIFPPLLSLFINLIAGRDPQRKNMRQK